MKVKIHEREIGIARDIVREAEGRYGCVVGGRRGLSEVLDFFMGRVSKKVVHMAEKQAVWVVNR